MGDGLILQQGTHSELLRDEYGPYSRLVAAQRLREKHDVELRDSNSNPIVSGETNDAEKNTRNENPLGRKDSHHSLASGIMKQKKKLQGDEIKQDDHTLPYLFMRMGKLNRAGWRPYGLGVVAACGIYPSYAVCVGCSNWS